MSLHGAHKLVEHSVADCEQNKGRCAVVNDDAGHCAAPKMSGRSFSRDTRILFANSRTEPMSGLEAPVSHRRNVDLLTPHRAAAAVIVRFLSSRNLAKALSMRGIVAQVTTICKGQREGKLRFSLLTAPSPDEIFRHPDDNWLKKLFSERRELLELLKERNPDELSRIEQMIKLTFPKRANGE